MEPGCLIVVEGIDGAGKSSLINPLSRWLGQQLGRLPLLSREPGGTAVAEAIREVFLNHTMPPLAELLLAYAARVDHLHQRIQPALASGLWVLCDRFHDSSFAYQGARGLATELIEQLDNLSLGGFVPDLVLVLDVPAELAAERIGHRLLDRFEQQQLAFHQQVRAQFLSRAAAQPQRYAVLDGSDNAAHLLEQAQALISQRLIKR